MAIGPIRPKADTSNTFQPVKVFRRSELDVSSGKLAMANSIDTLGTALYDVGYKEAVKQSKKTGINEYRSLGADQLVIDAKQFLDEEETKPNPNFGKPVALGRKLSGGSIAREQYEELVIKGYFDSQEKALNNKNVELYNKVGKGGYSITKYQTDFSNYAQSLVKYALPQFKEPITKASAEIVTKNVIKLQQEQAARARRIAIERELIVIDEQINNLQTVIEQHGPNSKKVSEAKDKIKEKLDNENIKSYLNRNPKANRAVERAQSVAIATGTLLNINENINEKYSKSNKILSSATDAFKHLELSNNTNNFVIENFNKLTNNEFKSQINKITKTTNPSERKTLLTNIRQTIEFTKTNTAIEQQNTAFETAYNPALSDNIQDSIDTVLSSALNGIEQGSDLTDAITLLDNIYSEANILKEWSKAGGNAPNQQNKKFIQSLMQTTKNEIEKLKPILVNQSIDNVSDFINNSIDNIASGGQANISEFANKFIPMLNDAKAYNFNQDMGITNFQNNHKDVLTSLAAYGDGTYKNSLALTKAIANVMSGEYFIGSDELDITPLQIDSGQDRFDQSVRDVLNQNRSLLAQNKTNELNASLENSITSFKEDSFNIAEEVSAELENYATDDKSKAVLFGTFFDIYNARKKNIKEKINGAIDASKLYVTEQEKIAAKVTEGNKVELEATRGLLNYIYKDAAVNLGGQEFANNFHEYMLSGSSTSLDNLTRGSESLTEFFKTTKTTLDRFEVLKNELKSIYSEAITTFELTETEQEIEAFNTVMNSIYQGKGTIYQIGSVLTSKVKNHINDTTPDLDSEEFAQSVYPLALLRNSSESFVPDKIISAIKTLTNNPEIIGSNEKMSMVFNNLGTYFSTLNNNTSRYNIMKRLAQSNSNLSVNEINLFSALLTYRTQFDRAAPMQITDAQRFINTAKDKNLIEYFNKDETEKDILEQAQNIYNNAMGDENLSVTHFDNFMSQHGEYFQFLVGNFDSDKKNENITSDLSNSQFFLTTVKEFIDTNFKAYDEDEYQAFGPPKSNKNFNAIVYSEAEKIEFKNFMINNINENVSSMPQVKFMLGDEMIIRGDKQEFLLSSDYEKRLAAIGEDKINEQKEFKGKYIPIKFASLGNNTFQVINARDGSVLIAPNKSFNNQATLYEFNINEVISERADPDEMSDNLIKQFRSVLTQEKFNRDLQLYSQGKKIVLDYFEDVKKDSALYQGYMNMLAQALRDKQNIYKKTKKLNEYFQYLNYETENISEILNQDNKE